MADVHIVETHDGSLDVWRRLGLREQQVIHVDAHHDCWSAEHGIITAANYLAVAARERIASEILWVVPDPAWEERASRSAIESHVAAARRNIGSVQLRAVPLCAVSANVDSVLLDVDVDFFVTTRIHLGSPDVPSMPWATPGALCEALAGCRADVVTIARSVEGAFTPLEWRFLADEIGDRFLGDATRRAGHEALRRAVTCRIEGRLDEARDALTAAATLGRCAPVLYETARQAYAAGDIDKARHAYAESVAADPAYGGRFRTIGFRLEAAGRLDEAGRAHAEALALDSADAFAALGLARVSLRRGNVAAAESLFRQALRERSDLPDAWNGLSKALSARGATRDAIDAAERARLLILRGAEVLASDGSFHRDPWLGSQHAHLAALYASAGETRRAAEERRAAAAWGVP